MSAPARLAPLRVAVIADNLAVGGGIGRYTREYLTALARREDIEVLPVVAESGRGALDRLGLENLAEVVVIRGRGQIGAAVWERFRLGRHLERLGVDVVHGTKHFVPRGPVPSVLTVYDVMAITYANQFPWAKRWLLPRQYLASMRDATAIVVPTRTTLHKVATLEQDLADKAVVVPLAAPDELRRVPPTPLPLVATVEFALVVGDLSPRKNVSVLLDIWDDVHRETGLSLVAVGPPGWRSRETEARLERLVARKKAHWGRLVTDGELRWCYEHARLVLFPTLEEGYGFPIVEALMLGAPVVASTDPTLEEVSQGAADAYVDPQDRLAWRTAIREVAGRARRMEPVSLDQVSWDEHVRQVIDLYRVVTS